MPKHNHTAARRVTIHDVARELGVSTSTVSAALNGSGKLRQETRDQVRRMAAELGYQSSRAALALRFGRTGTIALALPTVDDGAVPMLDLDFYMAVARAAATAAFEAGYALTLTPPTLTGEDGWRLLGADGVVLCDPVRNDERLAALERLGTPVVTVERDAARPDGRSAVTSDHGSNLRTLLDHLHDQGARRIALISADASWSWAEESVAAYRDWTAERGLPESVRLIPLDQAHNDPYDTALGLLRAADRPDAIIATAEQYREGVLRACRDAEVRIPDDVLVALGIDSPGSERNDPALTAIDLQPGLQAKLAVSMLLRLIEGEQVDGPMLSDAVLRVRASTLRPA
ncbi:LacI family DNA-binding transcriptional regulator [Mesorhizobium sp.]|uniref:LacI family DNA-binding transcriptional regulator n=1 Tax=Mesorhizobium sp. TaxID=1871066 RepID=UPI0025FBAD50|nr:LacI family DNA-binding transcriptional regulator [Mesorhizobium sp.]